MPALDRLGQELDRQGQLTDRYAKAIDQLGSEKLDVRIGGIYGLERLARDSARDHPTVMEVLTAFIREHSREQWPPPDPYSSREQERSTRPDVQAAVTVLGRRDQNRDTRPIDLTGADLGRADLTGADLTGADLTGAWLNHADLTGATLGDAHLRGTALWNADLTDPRLLGTDLTGADLRGANLTGATLTGAPRDSAGHDTPVPTNLTRADLTGEIFTDARWPERAAPPQGWQRHPGSDRLERVSKNPGAAPQPEV